MFCVACLFNVHRRAIHTAKCPLCRAKLGKPLLHDEFWTRDGCDPACSQEERLRISELNVRLQHAYPKLARQQALRANRNQKLLVAEQWKVYDRQTAELDPLERILLSVLQPVVDFHRQCAPTITAMLPYAQSHPWIHILASAVLVQLTLCNFGLGYPLLVIMLLLCWVLSALYGECGQCLCSHMLTLCAWPVPTIRHPRGGSSLRRGRGRGRGRVR